MKKEVSVSKKIRRIIGIFLIVIVLIGGGFMGFTAYLMKSNDAYKGDYSAVIASAEESAPKALIVFQPSRSSASSDAADQLAKGLNDSGYEVTVTYPGKHLSTDLSSYSVVAFGSPVIGGKPSKMITNTLSKSSNFSEKTVILYSVGKMTEMPEMAILTESLKDKIPDYTEKFIVGDENMGEKAYALGLEVGERSEK